MLIVNSGLAVTFVTLVTFATKNGFTLLQSRISESAWLYINHINSKQIADLNRLQVSIYEYLCTPNY